MLSGPLRPLRLAVLVFSLLLIPLTLTACAAEPTTRVAAGCGITPVPCLSGTALVSLETSRGEVRIRLEGKDAPLTAGNFVDLVRRGVYDGTVFHRVVREPVPFVVQGGDPQSADPKTPTSQYGTGSFVEPGSGEARYIPLELRRQADPQPIYGSILTSPVEARDLSLTHKRGSVAMARSAAPDSASAQFYIALEALPELDGRYAVFGRVEQGMEVVDAIRQGDRLTRARLLEGGTLVKGKPNP
jgi:peptidyl-prolyl cis-trans isomerase B (cyclophilin B)